MYSEHFKSKHFNSNLVFQLHLKKGLKIKMKKKLFPPWNTWNGLYFPGRTLTVHWYLCALTVEISSRLDSLRCQIFKSELLH